MGMSIMVAKQIVAVNRLQVAARLEVSGRGRHVSTKEKKTTRSTGDTEAPSTSISSRKNRSRVSNINVLIWKRLVGSTTVSSVLSATGYSAGGSHDPSH